MRGEIKMLCGIVLFGVSLVLTGCGETTQPIKPTTTTPAPIETLVRQSLEEVDPAAVCTDGSPAQYYFAPAEGPNSMSANTWVVFLQGGGWCYDEKSCQSRCGTPDAPSTHHLCSSKELRDTMNPDGLFHPLNDELLRNANKVYVKYCTSDAHMGNNESFGFQFRGGVVVQAVLRDLVARHGLGGSAGRDRVIFGGGSAGARGAMVHLDYVSEMLGSASGNVDVVGFLDSPAYVDVKPLSLSFPGFPYISQQVHAFGNVSHLGAACAEAYPEPEQWKCMFGQYRLPTLTTPYFLVASQADSYQLEHNVGHRPRTNYERAYARDFAASTRALLDAVKAASPKNAVFSWQRYNHYMSTSRVGFDKLTAGGSIMDDALQQFLGLSLESAKNLQLSWIDGCNGFACSEEDTSEVLNAPVVV